MIKIYTISQADEWNDVVRSFPNHDVYYLSGYCKAFEVHGDGAPELLYYEEGMLRAIYVYMKRQIASGMVDTVTPYGYGGVLFDGDTSTQNIELFGKAFEKQMQNDGVVSNFVRYHPVLKNAGPMKQISEVIDLGKTIAIDLSSPEIIWENIHSKNRNMIRKAEKNSIEIKHGKGMDLFEKFMEIYNKTMDKDHAEAYYYFKLPFYESIHNDLYDNYEMFYAEYEGKIIAMSIMIFANGRLNYHLSGSDIEYRNLAPSNLLLYKAALWGCEQGMKTFHLGGGVGSGEDNLYKFKAAFNKISDYQFSIGKQVFDKRAYDELVKRRKETDANFDESSHFFPLYRA
jgi:hypothetical protein